MGTIIDAANYPASEDHIDCGSGADRVKADQLDVIAGNCEAAEIVREVELTLSEGLPADDAIDIAESLNADPKELILYS